MLVCCMFNWLVLGKHASFVTTPSTIQYYLSRISYLGSRPVDLTYVPFWIVTLVTIVIMFILIMRYGD